MNTESKQKGRRGSEGCPSHSFSGESILPQASCPSDQMGGRPLGDERVLWLQKPRSLLLALLRSASFLWALPRSVRIQYLKKDSFPLTSSRDGRGGCTSGVVG